MHGAQFILFLTIVPPPSESQIAQVNITIDTLLLCAKAHAHTHTQALSLSLSLSHYFERKVDYQKLSVLLDIRVKVDNRDAKKF